MSEDFSITIPVSAEMLRDAAATAVARAFYAGREGFRDTTGVGYNHINSEVLKAIKGIDFAPYIQRALDDALAPTIAEVVAEAVRAEVKKQIKAIKAGNNEL